MKCHYVYDKKAGKVLIPGCWSVVHSGDIEDCTCRYGDEDMTPAGFARERYNQEIAKKNAIIKDLQEEVKYLHSELERHVKLLNNKYSKTLAVYR